MRGYEHIKCTRREFIRDKRRSLKKAKKACGELRTGCLCRGIYGTDGVYYALKQIDAAIEIIDNITRPLR